MPKPIPKQIFKAKSIAIKMVQLFVIVLFIFSAKAVFSQPCSNPGQTVETAFPVCGATIFNQTTVPNCVGLQPVPALWAF
jgi:hypothetical protein